MGDDYVTLVFSTLNPVYFKLGDYCDIEGHGRFELITPYQPAYNNKTNGYDYELRLDAQHLKWRNKMMRYLPTIGGSECSFTLTATADVHLQQVLENITALSRETLMTGDKVIHQNYLYLGKTSYRYAIAPDVEASAKTISYDSINIIDALTAIAEAFDTEWWMSGNTICLGKCEMTNEYIDLEVGVNVAEMSRNDSSEDLVTRILAFGSDRNISPRYRKDLVFDVKEVQNNGNRISDTSRPLEADWFPTSLVAVASDEKLTFNFGKSYSGTVTSPNATDQCLLFTETISQKIKAGDWRIDLSRFTPSFNATKLNGVNEVWTRIIVNVGTLFAQWDSPKSYLPYDGCTVKNTFQDQELTIPADSTAVITVQVFAVVNSAGGSATINANTYSNRITFAICNPNVKINGLEIQVLNTDGSVSKTITGAIFNPDHADTYTDRNWIQLPGGVIMTKGQRYRISNIIASKVKSSYFSSRYAAYSGYDNVVKNGIVTSRLMLPVSHGTPYVDYLPNMSMEEGVEDVVVFEDIYPRAVCAITKVDTIPRKETSENDDGTTSDTTFTAFRIKDDFFTSARPFTKDYIVPGETLKITFQDGKRYKEGDNIPEGKRIGMLVNPNSGKLNGWTFEVQFTKDADGSAIWEIVRDNESFVPNDILRPEIGDQFVLTGFDIAAVNDLFVEEAEKELLEKAKKYLEKVNTDTSTYQCTMMPDVMAAGLSLGLGKRINLINEAFAPCTLDADGRRWGRKSRVIGYEVQLDISYDNPIYTIGEKAAYSRFGAIEDKIDALKFSMAQGKGIFGGFGGGVATEQQSNVTGGVYVIGQTDVTPASETNVYSALRSIAEFCSKKASEVINYLWKFTQGIHIGNYVLHNDGAKIDPNGDAEFNEVEVRKGLSVEDGVQVGGDVNIQGDLQVRNGVTIGDYYQPGAYGGRIWVDELGKVHIETDYLEAREKLQAKEIEIQEETHVGGCQILSPAAMRCSRVISVYNDANSIIAYKCFFTAEDPETGAQIHNQFDVDDLAKCETFNLVKQANGKMGNHYYWRKVLEIGYVSKGDADYDEDFGKEGYILLSNVAKEKDPASDTPMVGDRIITVGNANPAKKDRSNLIILASYGTGSPYIYQYQGINTFALTKDNLKTAISPNGNVFTGKFVIENGSEEVDVVDYIENNIYLEAYQLALSNEMAAVPCDADGNPLYDLPSSKITIFKGKVVESGWLCKLDCVGCKASIVADTIYLSQLTEKNATITVTAIKKGCPTLTKVMTVCKVKDGEGGVPGDHAVQFEIEPDKPIVLADMDGKCDPTELGCKVYMVIGNQNRIEVPLSNTAPLTTYTAGDKLLFFNGRLFVNRPVEVDVPTDLVLRYVIVNQDYITDDDGKVTPVVKSESEHIYVGQPIPMTSRIKHVIFKLYRGTYLVDMQTVIVTTDATAMKVTYNTRFEITDKRIEMEASRISANEEAITDLQLTADGLKLDISKQSGIIQDMVNGAGRNLLLWTGKPNQMWEYHSNSMAGVQPIGALSNPKLISAYSISGHDDSSYEHFAYPLRCNLIEEGKKYAFSVHVKLPGSGPVSFFAMIANPNDLTAPLTDVVYLDPPLYHTEAKFECVLTATATGSKNGTQMLILGITPATIHRWEELQIWHPKLEKGETCTAWAEAPEDDPQQKYNELSNKIEITAEGIRGEMTQQISEAEGRITKAYKGEIELTAKGLRTSFEEADEELGASISEIEQTARSISLKVDEIAGYANLITGNETGQGWLLTNYDNAELAEPTPSDGTYWLTCPDTSEKVLRTPLFTLQPNTKYTLSFEHSDINPQNINGFVVAIKHGDAAATLCSQTIVSGMMFGTVSADRKAITFSVGNTLVENTFVEFIHKGNKAGVLQSTTIRIKKVVLETGEVAHPYVDTCTGLLATGIDIYSRVIRLTSDNVIICNNAGEQTVMIDKNGKIDAKLMHASQELTCGEEGGKQIKITAEQKAIEIYDENGVLASKFDGNSETEESLFGSGKGTAPVTSKQGLFHKAYGSSGSGLAVTTEPLDTYRVIGEFATEKACEVTMSGGHIFAAAYSPTSGNSGSSGGGMGQVALAKQASATTTVTLEIWTYETSSTRTPSKKTLAHIKANASYDMQLEAEEYGNRVTTDVEHKEIKNAKIKTSTGGTHKIVVAIDRNLSLSTDSGEGGWGYRTSNSPSPLTDGSYDSEIYISRWFENGFCLGNSTNDYIMGQRTSSGMVFKVVCGEHGLKVSKNGVETW